MPPLLGMRSAIFAFVWFLLSVAPASAQAWKGHSPKQSLRGDSVVSKTSGKATSAAHSASTPKATTTTSHKAESIHAKTSNHNIEMVTKEIKALEKAASSLSSTTTKAASKGTTHAVKNSTSTSNVASTNALWAGHSKKSSTAKKTKSSKM